MLSQGHKEFVPSTMPEQDFLTRRLKGERAYRALYEDMKEHMDEWLAFFQFPENHFEQRGVGIGRRYHP